MSRTSIPQRCWLLLLSPLLLLHGCSRAPLHRASDETQDQSVQTEDTARDLPVKIQANHLPNAVLVHPRVISGGSPEGDAAFQELQSLGVRTVISVDGMKPDTQTASKFGLRYVHLPHGYDGVPEHRAKELAKAVRTLDGSIYIHCHHGRHRSPAAASVACVAAGLLPSSKAIAVLELAGTSLKYRGLYDSVRKAELMESAFLDEFNVEFRSSAEVPMMAEVMVEIGHTHDRLQQIAKSGWKSPSDHPDLDPAHEALLMSEHFTELLRTESVLNEPDEFRRLLRGSEELAQQLMNRIDASSVESPSDLERAEIENLMASLSTHCTRCHQQFRDIPLNEKSVMQSQEN